jgi:membrane protein DedA with SNARE-associated domain
MHSLLLSITKYSYFEIFIALGLGIVGLPIPDETFMAYAGFLVFQGKLIFLYTILVAFMGTSCGITIGYVLGKRLGNPFIKKYASKMHMNPDDIREAEIFYNRYGKFALFIGYFIPGIRHFTAIFAGTSLTLVSLGYFLGEKWRHIYMYSHRFIIPLVLLSILVLLIGIYWNTVKVKKE